MPVLDKRNPESVAAVQRYLIDNGYLTEEAARGGWGPKSQAAYDRMTSNNENNSGIRRLSLDEAREQYSEPNNTGLGSVVGRYLKHTLFPEKILGHEIKITPNKGLKQQAAAIIGHVGNGSIGNHQTYLNSNSSNPNKQQDGKIGLSKSWGAFSWEPDENGNIKIEDTYDFHMLHTPNIDSNGNPIYDKNGNLTYSSKSYKPEELESMDRGNWPALKGLYQDLKGGYWKALFNGNNTSEIIQTLAENFGTRQGKTRDSSFTLSVEDINRWNQ